MEQLIKKEYVDSRIYKKDVGMLGTGEYSYPELIGAKLVVIELKNTDNKMETAIFNSNSYVTTPLGSVLTFTMSNTILINSLVSGYTFRSFTVFY